MIRISCIWHFQFVLYGYVTEAWEGHRKEYFFSAGNIFWAAGNIFYAGNIFWAAGNIFWAAGNIFSAGNIFWVAGNNFWAAGNIFPRGIFSGPRGIILPRGIISRPRGRFFCRGEYLLAATNILGSGGIFLHFISAGNILFPRVIFHFRGEYFFLSQGIFVFMRRYCTIFISVDVPMLYWTNG